MRTVCVLLKYRGPSLLEHWESCPRSSSKHGEVLSSLWVWNGLSLSVCVQLTAPVLEGTEEEEAEEDAAWLELSFLQCSLWCSCFSSRHLSEQLSGWSTSFIWELSLRCRAMSGGGFQRQHKTVKKTRIIVSFNSGSLTDMTEKAGPRRRGLRACSSTSTTAENQSTKTGRKPRRNVVSAKTNQQD